MFAQTQQALQGLSALHVRLEAARPTAEQLHATAEAAKVAAAEAQTAAEAAETAATARAAEVAETAKAAEVKAAAATAAAAVEARKQNPPVVATVVAPPSGATGSSAVGSVTTLAICDTALPRTASPDDVTGRGRSPKESKAFGRDKGGKGGSSRQRVATKSVDEMLASHGSSK